MAFLEERGQDVEGVDEDDSSFVIGLLNGRGGGARSSTRFIESSNRERLNTRDAER